MGYPEDLRALDRLEKLRVLCVVIALLLLCASVVVEGAWIHLPRAAAWGGAALFSALEARVLRRLGRDPDITYLWALAYAGISAFHLYLWYDG